MFRLDQDSLARCETPLQQVRPRDSKALASDLGGLARWLLRSEVLDLAASAWEQQGNPDQAEHLRRSPRLPRTRGSCWVVFVVDQPRYPLLREAFVLPLRWQRWADVETVARWGSDLPAPLVREAKSVLQVLHAFKTSGERSQPTDWSLRLNVDSQPDLYNLEELDGLTDASSGWASLAAGWLIAARGGLIDPSVWASACWDDNGLQPVRGLDAKLRLASELGAKRFFAVPAQRGPETGALAQRLGLRLEDLEPDTVHPLHALRPLARALAVPPEAPQDPDSWEMATAYYHLLRTDLNDPKGAAEFYLSSVLPAVVAGCRGQSEQQDPELLGQRGSLITILSGSPELVELAVLVFRPRRCLVLFTSQTEGQLTQARQRITAAVGDCSFEWELIDRQLRPGGLPARVHSFARAFPDWPVLIDLTPGTKLMTLALDRDLSDCRARRFYFMTEQRGQEIRLGTYQLVVL